MRINSTHLPAQILIVGLMAAAMVAASEAAAPGGAAAPPTSETAATTTAATDAFTLSWWSVDGGGGSSSGGTFTLAGTTGQPDVGTAAGYGQVADGGLWSGNRVTIFADDLELGDTGQWSSVVP